MNLFGEFLPTGTVKQQLEQVQEIHQCKSGAELHRKWCEIMYPQISEYQARDIVNAERQARELLAN